MSRLSVRSDGWVFHCTRFSMGGKGLCAWSAQQVSASSRTPWQRFRPCSAAQSCRASPTCSQSACGTEQLSSHLTPCVVHSIPLSEACASQLFGFMSLAVTGAWQSGLLPEHCRLTKPVLVREKRWGSTKEISRGSLRSSSARDASRIGRCNTSLALTRRSWKDCAASSCSKALLVMREGWGWSGRAAPLPSFSLRRLYPPSLRSPGQPCSRNRRHCRRW